MVCQLKWLTTQILLFKRYVAFKPNCKALYVFVVQNIILVLFYIWCIINILFYQYMYQHTNGSELFLVNKFAPLYFLQIFDIHYFNLFSPYLNEILTACPKIENCLEMHCHETASSTICANCDGVVRDLPYYQAYIRSDNLKRCERN